MRATGISEQYRLPAHRSEGSGIWGVKAADIVLFLFALISVGVFDPQLDVTNFDKLTVRNAVTEFSSANPFNQIRWLVLSAVAGLLVLRNPTPMLRCLPLIWPIAGLFLLCILSTTWSAHPEVTARRAMGLILPGFCLLASMAYVRPGRAARVMYLAFWCALILNLVVMPLPVTVDEFGFYRGAYGNKNSLGSLAALAILLGLAIRASFAGGGARLLNASYLVVWSVILVMTVSKASIGLTLVIPPLLFLLDNAARLARLDIGSALLLSVLSSTAVVGVAVGLTGAAPGDLLSLILPDVTFTGRTQIWGFMLAQIDSNWWLGRGFGALWGVGFSSPNLSSIHNYVRMLNQAHNGYFDVIASIGLIGLGALALVIGSFSRAAERLRDSNPALFRLSWMLMLFSLLHNGMESSLLVPFNCVWHITMFAAFAVIIPEPDEGPCQP